MPQLPAVVSGLCEEFRESLETALGDSFASLYVFGALSFPRPAGWLIDVDFHVLLHRHITERERVAVRDLHAYLAISSPLGGELDGHYILLDDATGSEPPTSQVWDVKDSAWALHRAHVLAGRFYLLSGMNPSSILPPPTWPELEHALDAEVHYIRAHPEHAAYGILNGCRVIYSLRNRDVVVSKYEAAQWALRDLPSEWSDLIAAALRFYTQAPHKGDSLLLDSHHSDFLAFLDEARSSPG